MPQPFSRDQIVQVAKTCSSKSAQSIISMEDLKNANPSGVEIIVPSQCDSKNMIFYAKISFPNLYHGN